MEKSILLLLLMCLLWENVYSQVKVHAVTPIETDSIQSDSINLSPNKDFEKRINLKPIEKSENKVEIWFYKHEGLSNTIDLKVLVLKGELWEGILYSESNYPKIIIKKLGLEAQKGFPEIVRMLLQNNLIQLPSQEELKSKMKKYIDTARGRAEQIMFINDGYSYTVELKYENKCRIYTFHNPDEYANFYVEVQELKDYVAIKNIFETELKVK